MVSCSYKSSLIFTDLLVMEVAVLHINKISHKIVKCMLDQILFLLDKQI